MRGAVFGRMGIMTLLALRATSPAHAESAPVPVPPRIARATSTEPILRKVAISDALRRALAGKRRYDPNSLASVLTYSGSIPRLALRPDKVIALEPVTNEPSVPKTAITALSPKLRQRLEDHQARFRTVEVGRPTRSNSTSHEAVQTAVRDQGSRNTSVAFAAVAALESQYKRAFVIRDLSENHAYNVLSAAEYSSCTSDTWVPTWKAASSLTHNLICEEAESPYVASSASACRTIPGACQAHRTHGYTSTDVFFAPAFGGTGTSIATNTSFLEALLDLDYDIVMNFYLAGSNFSDGTATTLSIDVQLDAQGNPAGAFGASAMLIVGYNARFDSFIVKNSWGTDVGRNGYFYLSYEYVQTYAKYGFVVTEMTGT